MSHGVRITAMFHKVRLSALMLALGLTMAMPALLRAEQSAGKESIEQRVVPTHRDFKLKDAESGAERAAKIAIYHVDQVKGVELMLSPNG